MLLIIYTRYLFHTGCQSASHSWEWLLCHCWRPALYWTGCQWRWDGYHVPPSSSIANWCPNCCEFIVDYHFPAHFYMGALILQLYMICMCALVLLYCSAVFIPMCCVHILVLCAWCNINSIDLSFSKNVSCPWCNTVLEIRQRMIIKELWSFHPWI